MSRHDVVVVGGGIGGLTCGALLARAGRSVVVVEAEERAGGFARNLIEDGYDFDLGLHVIMSLGADGPFGEGMAHAVLSHLGVAEQVEHVALDPFYSVQLGDGEQVVLPGTLDGYVAALSELSRSDARGVEKLFGLYEQAYREFIGVPISLRVRDLLRMPAKTPLVFAKRNATLAQVLDAHVRNQKVKHVHTALWPYIGLPASRMAFLPFGAMMASYLGEGAYYCRGGFQALADALARGLVDHGGELLLGTTVSKIDTSGRRVTGVELDSGQRIEATQVVSNVDARKTFDGLIDAENVPNRYRRKLRRQRPSMSVCALHLGTDLDVASALTAQITFVAPRSSEESYARSVQGGVGGVSITVPTLTDPSRAPEGKHTVVVMAAVPVECGERPEWDDRAVAEEMLAMADEALPGLSSHITFVAGGNGSRELRPRYLGPIYGWAFEPKQVAAHRLPHETPFSGLWLCGHWTQPGAGVWGVVASGVQTARLMLDRHVHAGLMPLALA